MTQPLIEICVEGIDGFLAAQEAGADRVELCASLLEGGITPSFGVVAEAQRQARIPIHVIVRPRGGDFLYTNAEFETMRADVVQLKTMGVAGVVVGCLSPNGTIDEVRMTALVAAARPMSVTCHRAIDMTRDVVEAIDALARCRVDRVLTSGQQASAIAGASSIRRAVEAARGRLKVMVCGEIDATNVGDVLRWTGADELHFAALRTIDSGMQYRNVDVAMGDEDRGEYDLTVTDKGTVEAIIELARR